MLEILILTESDFSVYILCQNEYKDTVNYFCEYIVFFLKRVSSESIKCLSLWNGHGLNLDIFKIHCIRRGHFKTARIDCLNNSINAKF